LVSPSSQGPPEVITRPASVPIRSPGPDSEPADRRSGSVDGRPCRPGWPRRLRTCLPNSGGRRCPALLVQSVGTHQVRSSPCDGPIRREGEGLMVPPTAAFVEKKICVRKVPGQPALVPSTRQTPPGQRGTFPRDCPQDRRTALRNRGIPPGRYHPCFRTAPIQPATGTSHAGPGSPRAPAAGCPHPTGNGFPLPRTDL
jgi:hypothetical protein